LFLSSSFFLVYLSFLLSFFFLSPSVTQSQYHYHPSTCSDH
jgi:hypothetical protein